MEGFFVLLFVAAIVVFALKACNNDQSVTTASVDPIEESLSEARNAQGELPSNFAARPEDGYIEAAHVCAVIMKNRIYSDNWFRWANSATDKAPKSLLRRAKELRIDYDVFPVSRLFEGALTQVTKQLPGDFSSQGAEFTFWITTTSDTAYGLTQVLREYSCVAFPSGNFRLQEGSRTLY